MAWQRAQKRQRPLGRNTPSIFQEPQGSKCEARAEWDWAHRVGDKLREERGGRWANDAAL